MKKVSFDFDDTLTNYDVQVFARVLVNKGYEVYIVTSRYNTEDALKNGWHWTKAQNEQLFEIADNIGIKRENIIFTNFEDKITYLKDKNFIFHLDDSADELMRIKESGDSCYPMSVDYNYWEQDLKELLKK